MHRDFLLFFFAWICFFSRCWQSSSRSTYYFFNGSCVVVIWAGGEGTPQFLRWWAAEAEKRGFFFFFFFPVLRLLCFAISWGQQNDRTIYKFCHSPSQVPFSSFICSLYSSILFYFLFFIFFVFGERKRERVQAQTLSQSSLEDVNP